MVLWKLPIRIYKPLIPNIHYLSEDYNKYSNNTYKE